VFKSRQGNLGRATREERREKREGTKYRKEDLFLIYLSER
jgi:hypothetical protein